MSDGNFNRALLPKNELTAGIRAGKAQMRAKAEQAFQETIEHFLPYMTDEAKREMKEEFMSRLRNK
ncbi:MAG: hypothetical protein K5899_12610 [Bacteroidaceae bacterium]|nr:hypothetical protein [Bacteroidaceae bacterium]